jgi:hypothetical protein
LRWATRSNLRNFQNINEENQIFKNKKFGFLLAVTSLINGKICVVTETVLNQDPELIIVSGSNMDFQGDLVAETT